MVYARMLITGEINWQKCMNVYDRTEQKPEWKAKKLLRRKVVQELINKEIEKILEKEKITPEFILQKRKEILNKALEKGDLTNSNRSLDALENLLAMKPKEMRYQITEQYDFSKHLPPEDLKRLEE